MIVDLFVASKIGDLDKVKFFVENGMDVNDQDNESIKGASYCGHLKVVKYLAENGANVRVNTVSVLKMHPCTAT